MGPRELILGIQHATSKEGVWEGGGGLCEPIILHFVIMGTKLCTYNINPTHIHRVPTKLPTA